MMSVVIAWWSAQRLQQSRTQGLLALQHSGMIALIKLHHDVHAAALRWRRMRASSAVNRQGQDLPFIQVWSGQSRQAHRVDPRAAVHSEGLSVRWCSPKVRSGGSCGWRYLYVADTGRRNAAGQVIWGLFSKKWGGRRVEWVSGVDALHFGLQQRLCQLSASDLHVHTQPGPIEALHLPGHDVPSPSVRQHGQKRRTAGLALDMALVTDARVAVAQQAFLLPVRAVYADGAAPYVGRDGRLHTIWQSYVALERGVQRE